MSSITSETIRSSETVSPLDNAEFRRYAPQLVFHIKAMLMEETMFRVAGKEEMQWLLDPANVNHPAAEKFKIPGTFFFFFGENVKNKINGLCIIFLKKENKFELADRSNSRASLCKNGRCYDPFWNSGNRAVVIPR